MKSVIHESSSIFKAIEQGWEKAGKPREFSIKILQEAQKNFLGMTVANAKVALFFGEPLQTQQKPTPEYKQQPYRQQQNRPHHHRRPRQQRPQAQEQQQQSSNPPITNKPQQ